MQDDQDTYNGFNFVLVIEKLEMNNHNISIEVSGQFNETGYEIFNVIDGRNETDPGACNCCFATDYGKDTSWLQLNISEPHLVYQIQIIGRSNCK